MCVLLDHTHVYENKTTINRRGLTVVISRLEQASIDPKVLAAQEKEAAEQRARAELDAWERYLADNPGMAEWAKANPALAAQKREQWLKENPSAVKHSSFDVPATFNLPL